MKRFVLLAFCLVAFPTMASHIVGGEFEIIHIAGNRYRINLIYYFDVLNNGFGGVPPELSEPTINTAIFQKSNDMLMDYVVLTFVSRTPVNYTQPECTADFIVTERVLYSAEYIFSPVSFNHPEGYYIAWERCCRNYTITNIVSKEPPENTPNFPDAAGQTFYLEFPPVVKDGEPFINSTPRLFPPLNDFGCPYRPYFADFAGVDDDGDSLAYSLVVPLSTHLAEAAPPTRPGPYPQVKWETGYSLDNIMNGDPDLTISQQGLLRVVPTQQGLYVFAVKCEEFRDGVKIGEVRRDFQMLVVDGCQPADPPQILGKALDESDYAHDEQMTVTFDNTVTDEDRCVNVQISDPDAGNPAHNFSEKIKIKAVALNFKGDMSGVLPDVISGTLNNGSTVSFDICFEKCPPIDGPFEVGIIAMDDECSLPLMDTLKITVNIDKPANAPPSFLTADIAEEINEGEVRSWPIEGVDPDGDSLTVGIVTNGFTLESIGMSVNHFLNDNGTYEGELVWDPKCNVYDFSQFTQFSVTILLEDDDYCTSTDADILTVDLGVILPDNSVPEISTDLTPEELANGVVRQVYDPLTFNVNGTDDDDDQLVLVALGQDFNLADYGMSFPKDVGNGAVSSVFSWDVPCPAGELREDYQLHFVVVDSANYCNLFLSDVLTVNVHVEPPDNITPDLNVVNTNPELVFDNHEQSLRIGQQISLGLHATDVNNDNITIDLFEATGNVAPVGYVFAPVTGVGSAQTTFAWNPDCAIFQDNVFANAYTFRFIARDDRCHNLKADTVDVKFHISDIPSAFTEFLPPNRLTPNNDTYNEFFAMMKEVDAELVSILPPDNCQGQFIGISVYNRWGREVFTSNDRNFRWYPDDDATGVYYYTLRFSNREYKGSVALRSNH